MKTNQRFSRLGRVAQLAIGLGAVLVLHWSLKTLAPALSWLAEPSFVQSLAAAIAIVASGALVNVTRGMMSGPRNHERRTRQQWDLAGPTVAEAKS